MDDLLRAFNHDLARERGTRAVLLVGSYARGDHDAYSDLDLHVLTDDATAPPTTVAVRGGVLVTISRATVQAREAAFHDATTAAWNILPLRTAHALHDPDGVYAALRARAEAFTWTSVAPSAHARLRALLTASAEEAQKVLGGLRSHTPEKALFAATGLTWSMAEVSVLAHGALIPTENRYLSTARDAEPDPEWREALWTAFGFTAADLTVRAHAALRLYARALHLHDQHLSDEDRSVTRHALTHLQAAFR